MSNLTPFKNMKIIRYYSKTQLIFSFDEEKQKHSKIYDNEISLSYRTYDYVGNTIELHIFYKQ